MTRQALLRPVIPLIVIVGFCHAPVAHAKELPVEICGADGCVTVADRGDAGMLHSTGARRTVPGPAPFFVVRFRSEAGSGAAITWSYVYVPSLKAMRANDFGSGPQQWMDARFLDPLIAQLTKGREPYPPSTTWSPTVRARRNSLRFKVNAVLAAAVVAVMLLPRG